MIGTGLSYRAAETDAFGEAVLFGVPPDDYRLVVDLPGAEGAEKVEERVSVKPGESVQFETLRVGLAKLPNGSSVTSVLDLGAPKKAKELYAEGVNYLHRQRWREARTKFEQAVEIYPKFPTAYNALGVAAAENGDIESASSAFRKAIDLRTNYSEAYLNFANALIRQRRFAQAEPLLLHILSFQGQSRLAMRLLAQCLFEQQKYAEVLNFVHETHVKNMPHDCAIHRFSSEIYRRRGMVQEYKAENTAAVAESCSVL